MSVSFQAKLSNFDEWCRSNRHSRILAFDHHQPVLALLLQVVHRLVDTLAEVADGVIGPADEEQGEVQVDALGPMLSGGAPVHGNQGVEVDRYQGRE